ncbi:hypothetical protein INT45_012345 [Circinella minor]|uniref:Uncharacterized protein n=1 Tax=Circinella minor TaxID=1195481 RepID=A0A8H7RXJ2_9FUNG|nr:hypothetical protein INT45_012345 [Circinella minor]
MYRSNVVPEDSSVSDILRIQPDAMICKIDQMSWSYPVGHGEAKLAENNTNTDALGPPGGLAELTALPEPFECHSLVDAPFYTMTELLSIPFPKSVEQLDAFTTRNNLESLVCLYKVFWNHCVKNRDEEKTEEPTSPCLDLFTIQAIKEGSIDRTRECALEY